MLPAKPSGNCVRHVLAGAINPFASDAQQWQRRSPSPRAHLSEAHFDGRIAICISLQCPFEAQV